VFDVLMPHLVDVYEQTMRETDQITDAPTIELLEDAVRKRRRNIAWGHEVLDRLCETDALRERRRARADVLNQQLVGSGLGNRGSPAFSTAWFQTRSGALCVRGRPVRGFRTNVPASGAPCVERYPRELFDHGLVDRTTS
jgi:hypothetical protein